MIIVEEAKRFLKAYLKDKSIHYDVFHPWRKSSTFIVLHSLRVHQYAVKIIENCEDQLTKDEMLVIELAAILHDLGRANHTKENHGQLSAKIVSEWLDAHPSIMREIKNKDQLLQLIATHSDKDERDPDVCSMILRDADLLDEVGAMGIYMTSYRVPYESPFYFNELLNKIKEFEIPHAQRDYKLLKTTYGKKIMEEKIQFLNTFIEQLTSELAGTQDYDCNM